MDKSLLEINDLHVKFDVRHGEVEAVGGVDFRLARGGVLGIVGESGSGKSVTCLAIMGLLPSPPARIDKGQAIFRDRDLIKMSEKERRQIRGKEIAMVFQDPMTALNPYLKIGIQLIEALYHHEGTGTSEARKRAVVMLERVGLASAEKCLDRYPHEFSGGMRQRICIAMALLTRPLILIADEPTTALDVTIQAQILELLKDLTVEFGMSLILISHDLGVVAEMADEVLVMYAGRIAERGAPADLFSHPKHPYTRGLIRSIPNIDEPVELLIPIRGNPPDPSSLPKGCPFFSRCDEAIAVCENEYPEESRLSDSHRYHCHVDI